jgi:hypothetical protein
MWMVLLLTVMSSVVAGTAADASELKHSALVVQLIVMNQAELPDDVLGEAQQEMRRIYAAAGLRLVWNDDAEAPGHARLQMNLVRKTLGKAARVRDVMGIAARPDRGKGTVAYVFVTRIDDFARQHHIPFPEMLALVMAHEAGHLLLSAHSHSDTGLMQGRWDKTLLQGATRRRLTFTPEQVESMRSCTIHSNC